MFLSTAQVVQGFLDSNRSHLLEDERNIARVFYSRTFTLRTGNFSLNAYGTVVGGGVILQQYYPNDALQFGPGERTCDGPFLQAGPDTIRSRSKYISACSFAPLCRRRGSSRKVRRLLHWEKTHNRKLSDCTHLHSTHPFLVDFGLV
ncbi:hypothetical protein RvY_11879-1 [Ramazzottius varieornatus]|uniref:Uncharacterized protein n=1 Tax=Ramazzottius varieornatus TaxID=947166 RepID=A0A1D1VMZ0_RAMVA|nr:hypothetical protein RvY_11879-1 [Ramazzottius varieornatus]